MSAQLRAHTAALHREVDALLGLPRAIASDQDYIAWLGRFLGLYRPLEQVLAGLPAGDPRGRPLGSHGHSVALAEDLRALGAERQVWPHASAHQLPVLPDFAHGIGALYVLEGATLGGQLILRDLDARMGPAIAGATRFFGGRGDAVGPMWRDFRRDLDEFGHVDPAGCADALTGAERTFHAIIAWFAPFRAAGAR